MNVSQETLKALKQMGLSEYEAKAYAALTAMVTATASEISQVSMIPRSKTYEVLKKLAEREFIEIIPGKPLKFMARPPHAVFEKAIDEMENRMRIAEAELESYYEKQIAYLPAPIWIINGPENIVNKEMEIIHRARSSIFMVGGLFFKNEEDRVKPRLQRAIKKGVSVRILSERIYVVDQKKLDVLKQLGDLKAELKITDAPIPILKALIRDDEEMIIVFGRIIDENISTDTAIAIWNHCKDFTFMVKNLYNHVWNSV